MTRTVPPEARTIVYTTAFIVAIVTGAVLLILAAVGVADLATVKDIALWVLGILGLGSSGLAVANRPTKGTPEL